MNEQNLEVYEREYPGYTANWSLLKTLLLSHGGGDVVVYDYPDEFLPVVINSGRLFQPNEIIEVAGAPKRCFDNCIALHERTGQDLVVGYSLTPQMLWCGHAWIWDEANSVIIETSRKRLAYFGAVGYWERG